MQSRLVHRGPDDSGTYLSNNIALGMRRLAMIDLETGQQPIFNEDGTICTILNGEIYNYKQLRGTLIRLGHKFRTNSDTEILVHAYEEFGIEFITLLNGMFAFALWDQRSEKLLLVRDHLGVKPLYYTFKIIHYILRLSFMLFCWTILTIVNWI